MAKVTQYLTDRQTDSLTAPPFLSWLKLNTILMMDDRRIRRSKVCHIFEENDMLYSV